MLFIDWEKLNLAIGKLQGMASVLEMTEEIDLKKLNAGMVAVADALQVIANTEKPKLEDVKHGPDPKKGAKK